MDAADFEHMRAWQREYERKEAEHLAGLTRGR